MRDLNVNFITEKNKSANRPLFLYRIYAYDGTSDLFYTENVEHITFNGQLYTAFPINHEYIEELSSGQISTVKVKVANVSRVIQAYLERYDFRGKRVDIIQVWADRLNEPDNRSVDTYYIDSYVSNERDVEFTLSSKLDVIDLSLPSGRYLRTHCRWVFKSPECGYAGSEAGCDRTFQRCKALSNYRRFGGFPSIPFRNIYVIG